MALTAVAPDTLATVVTTLDMRERPPLRPLPESRLRLVRWSQPGTEAYRTLFRRVGAAWLWYSRLTIDDAALRAIIHDEAVHIFAATDPRGAEVGMLELDFRQPGIGALSYLALVPELTGQRHGRWLMAHALAVGWRPGVERLCVNTCTLDHPHALGFYRASGFVAVRRVVETFPDPRVLGVLPRDAAPQIPLLEAENLR